MTRVVKTITPEQQEAAFAVRRAVFVDEQRVPPDLEFDRFEQESVHFIAIDDEGRTCGAARWRFTEHGVKLERFVVLVSHRRQQIGSKLLQAVLDDVAANPNANGCRKYLNAQVDAVPLYAKFGFIPCGDVFLEADISHQAMERLD